jgi:5-formyltetrahydrofolate cyclo-ligase
MDAYEIAGAHDLTPGRYGIPEPKAHCLPVSPEDIDLIILPCVCCDREGYRLGYGGGFYDRWLSGRRARSAALCFENILVPRVPREPHDEPVDFIVTNAALRVV